jgi:hypothetical protein
MFKRILSLIAVFVLLMTSGAFSVSTARAAGDAARPLAVILVSQNDVLNVRKGAGANYAIVDRLDAHATHIVLTGKEKIVDGSRWVKIRRPAGGVGWVNAKYLTESVTPAVFCADAKVSALLASFKTAMTRQDGALLASLVSPAHGLNVTYLRTGKTITYTPALARWVFTSTYAANWGTQPASGLEVKGSFHAEVLPKILDVVSNPNTTANCNNPATGPKNYSFSWPFQYGNINYYALLKPGTPGTDLDWRTWLVGIEYVNGQPYLFSLTHLFWEP